MIQEIVKKALGVEGLKSMVRRAFIPLNCLAFISLLAGGPGHSASTGARDTKELKAQCEKLRAEGKYDQALPLAKQILALDEKNHGPDHPKTAASLNRLASLYIGLGSYAQAEALHQRALAIRENTRFSGRRLF